MLDPIGERASRLTAEAVFVERRGGKQTDRLASDQPSTGGISELVEGILTSFRYQP